MNLPLHSVVNGRATGDNATSYTPQKYSVRIIRGSGMKMKKIVKRTLLGLLVLIMVGSLGAFIYGRYFFTLDLFKEGPTTKVNRAGWSKLEKGMTKEQVTSLLGPRPAGFGPGTSTLAGRTYIISETWEYNWKSGVSLFGETDPRSYTVCFDEEGKLASWRAPSGKNGTEKTDSRTAPRTLP